ncbi:hypothetical protein ES703_36211 [subsurface metagenome]
MIADLLFAKIPLLHFSGDIIACFLGLPLLAKNKLTSRNPSYDIGRDAKSARSNRTDMTMPETNPQKGAPTFNNGMSAMVTRNATSAPKEKRLANAVTKVVCNTLNIARPANAATKDFGVLRSSRVKVGANSPNMIDRRPTTIPATYWRLRSAADDDGIRRPCQARADGANKGAGERADPTGDRHRSDRRIVPRCLEYSEALTVLHDQDGDRQRQDKLDQSSDRPSRVLNDRSDQLELQRRRILESAEDDRGKRANHQRSDDGRAAAAQPWDRGQEQPDRHHGSGDSAVREYRTDEVEAKTQKHAGNHSHHYRERNQFRQALHPAASTQHQDESARDVVCSDDLMKIQVRQ